jgi:S-adenosylmethionine hydrolase
MLELTYYSPKYSVICGTRRQIKPYNIYCGSYPLIVVYKYTPNALDAVHQVEFVEVKRVVTMTANHL